MLKRPKRSQSPSVSLLTAARPWASSLSQPVPVPVTSVRLAA